MKLPFIAALLFSVWVLLEADAPCLQRGLFHSKAAGEPVSCSVFKPESYDAAKESRFPVLYWLQGSSGSSPDCRSACGVTGKTAR